MAEEISRFNCGDMQIRYYKHEESIEWIIIPRTFEKKVCLPKKSKYDSLIQAKLVGDHYPKGFVTGATMRNSQTVKNLMFSEQTVREGDDQLTILTTLKDPAGNTFIHTVSWTHAVPVIKTFTTFKNNSSSPVTLEMLSSVSLSNLSPFHEKNECGNLWMTRYLSKWSFEGRQETRPIEAFQLEPSWKPSGVGLEKFGQVGSMPVRGYFPYLSVTDQQMNVTWAIKLAIPGAWQLEAYRLDEDLCLSGGIADRDYSHWTKKLQPQETFVTPYALLTVGRGQDEQIAQRITAFHEHRIEQRNHKTERELAIQFNEFCTTWGNPTQQSIAATAQALKDKGIDYYIIDAGWYADPEKGWERSHGDWQVNAKQFPEGLTAAVEEIRRCGMIPGIWFEIETVGCDAAASGFIQHVLQRDGVPLTVGDRRFWDMRDPWVRNYLKETVIDFLAIHNIGYLKIDYNENFGIGFDDNESMGEASRQQLAAAQLFIQEISQQLPELIIENCASGGHRLEPSMIELTDLSSFSDAHEAVSIPIIAANLHQLVLPKQSLVWAVLRRSDTPQRLYYSLSSTMLGRMCLSGDVHQLTSEQWAIVQAGIHFYNEIKAVIAAGVSSRHGEAPVSYRQPQGGQAVLRIHEQQVVVIAHSFSDACTLTIPLEETLQQRLTVVRCYGVKEQNIQVTYQEKHITIAFPDAWMGCSLLFQQT